MAAIGIKTIPRYIIGKNEAVRLRPYLVKNVKHLARVTTKAIFINTASSIFTLTLIFITLSFFQGCAPYRPFKPHPELIGYTETGRASYYALKFQFRRTASGETFNNLAMTAAHNTLPFGTKVRVTNVKNGKSITVMINDRGPFIKGRIIDLTRVAFSQIGDTRKGTIKVKIKVVK